MYELHSIDKWIGYEGSSDEILAKTKNQTTERGKLELCVNRLYDYIKRTDQAESLLSLCLNTSLDANLARTWTFR